MIAEDTGEISYQSQCNSPVIESQRCTLDSSCPEAQSNRDKIQGEKNCSYREEGQTPGVVD